MTAPLYFLGRFCARHPVPVLLVWLAIVILVAGVARNAGIQRKVQQQAAKKEKSSGQDDKEKFLESKASDPRLTDLRKDLQKTKGVDKVTLPLVNKKGDAAV